MGLPDGVQCPAAAAARKRKQADEADASSGALVPLPRKRSSLDLGDRPCLVPGPWGLSLKPRHWSCAEELNATLAAAAAAGALDPIQVRGVQHICRVPAGRGLIAERLAAVAARPAPPPPPAAPAAGPAAGPAAAGDDWRLRPRTPPPPDPDAAAHAALAAAVLGAGPLAPFPEHGASVYRVATPPCLARWAARWFGLWGAAGEAAAPPPSLRVVALHGWGSAPGGEASFDGPAPPRGLGGEAGTPRDVPARTVWVPFFHQQAAV